MKVLCPYCGNEIVDADDGYLRDNPCAEEEWIEDMIDKHVFGQDLAHEPECSIVWNNNL